MFTFRQVETDDRSLGQYAELFKVCFPKASHLDASYLRWLYKENPNGQVVGMDAIVGTSVAAHYACIPARVSLLGRDVRALLSLNTATHPDYQGKGLFTKLADATYEAAAQRRFAAVYGVANANSTPGFIRKLGFQLVAPLDARIGFGRQLLIDWDRACYAAQFRRLWDIEQLTWRARNPANPISVVANAGERAAVYAKTDKKGIWVWGETPISIPGLVATRPTSLAPILFLGLNPRGCVKNRFSFNMPDRMRPSPLNFIIRTLNNEQRIDSDCISFSFIDFDAY